MYILAVPDYNVEWVKEECRPDWLPLINLNSYLFTFRSSNDQSICTMSTAYFINNYVSPDQDAIRCLLDKLSLFG